MTVLLVLIFVAVTLCAFFLVGILVHVASLCEKAGASLYTPGDIWRIVFGNDTEKS